MSADIRDLIEKLKSLPSFVEDKADEAIESDKEHILDLNKAQMLVAGVDNEGISLGDYSPKSVQIRQKKGLQTDHIDLRFTGDFQDSLRIDKKKKAEFDLTATDGKWAGNEITPNLSQQWPDALGLTDDNEDKVTENTTGHIEREAEKYFETSQEPQKVFA